jgi:hypothetical protein
MWQFTYNDQIIGSSSSDDNTQVFRLNENETPGALSFYLNGTQVFSPTGFGIGINSWHHLAICRSGANTRMFVDGLQNGATNTSWTGTFRMDALGMFLFNGNPFSGQVRSAQFRGYIDDLLVAKTALYTSNFTPTGPHPTS